MTTGLRNRQGEQLVIDENTAAIEAEAPRQLAPLPEPAATPGRGFVMTACTVSLYC